MICSVPFVQNSVKLYSFQTIKIVLNKRCTGAKILSELYIRI